jgi:hypothetical protein
MIPIETGETNFAVVFLQMALSSTWINEAVIKL